MLGIPFLDDAIFKWFKPQAFDDPVDRLNYFVTSSLLTFFALMVSAKQYVGSPIQCWMPMEFKGGWEQYAEDYCFIQNTYYVAPEEEIPAEVTERDERQFGYYQWVPIMLALQAVMFYLPNWIWKTLHQQSGVDLETAISDARSLRSMSSSKRHQEMIKLAQYLNETLELHETHRTPKYFFCLRFGRSLGSYVSSLYLIIKLLYLVNVLAQFFLLNAFIGHGFAFWGWTAIQSLWLGDGWQDSPVFPRVSLCDFRVRRLANMHRYTVQCVLMINMFNEKIYLFIWFWMLLVGISTLINFLYCLFSLVPPSARERQLRLLLKQAKFQSLVNCKEAAPLLQRFANHALRPDGILLLRFIEGHAGAIVARELVAQLFSDYVHYSVKSAAKCLRTYATGSHSTKSTSPGGFEYEPLTPQHTEFGLGKAVEVVELGSGVKPKLV
ncbi:Innexin [Meloidogyne graminicola]|uniref:Innexin n=1 Tax=Meloidogyne graminicola TaxID=189291 RepID=A0A8S9ZX97_9BILA|nr:Innexin [Meloidogyne graminicola]